MTTTWAQSLIETVRTLASPAGEQLQYLDEIGGAEPDELALLFDDFYGPARGEFSADAQRVLDSINSLLNEMSGPTSGLWSKAAVRVAPEWVQIRQLSNEFLSNIQ